MFFFFLWTVMYFFVVEGMETKSQITKIRWSCIKLTQWLSLMAISLVSQTDWNTCRQPSWGLRSGRRNWPCPPLRRTAAGRTTPPRTGFETWVNVEFLLFTTCDSRFQNKPNSFIHPYLQNKFHVLDFFWLTWNFIHSLIYSIITFKSNRFHWNSATSGTIRTSPEAQRQSMEMSSSRDRCNFHHIWK